MCFYRGLKGYLGVFRSIKKGFLVGIVVVERYVGLGVSIARRATRRSSVGCMRSCGKREKGQKRGFSLFFQHFKVVQYPKNYGLCMLVES